MKSFLLSLCLIILLFSACKPAPHGEGAVSAASPNKAIGWPPVLGEKYPDVTLIDESGGEVKLADFLPADGLLLVEPIGMTCEACQAFAGGHLVGGLGNVTPQGGLKSIDEFFPEYTQGMSIDDDRIAYVQLILYNEQMGAPTAEDLKKWAAHFKTSEHSNRHVLGGTPDLIGQGSYKMIPGFQLIDSDFTLRSDAAGHSPPDSLWNDLLPKVRELLE